jgi:hypothetical protein
LRQVAQLLVQIERQVVRVHSPVQMPVQNSELVQILELVVFHPLVHQKQVLQLLPKTVLLVSTF